MNRQEAFDLLIERITDGKGQCVAKGSCVYDNGKGNHCAIGYLFHKSNFTVPSKHMKAPLSELFSLYAENNLQDKLPEWLRTRDDLEFYVEMQLIHDYGNAWDKNTFTDWPAVFAFAAQNGLELDAIPTEHFVHMQVNS